MIIKPEQFSQHLFWDVDINKVDLENRKKWIVIRILQYGLIEDWKLLIKLFGIEEISEIAQKSRDIDKKQLLLFQC
jgi:Family of unknown function (DUF6922)